MFYKLFVVILIICLTITSFYALSGKSTEDGKPLSFNSNTLLKIVEDSPRIDTDWILSLENIKVNFNIEQEILNFFKDLFNGEYANIFGGSSSSDRPLFGGYQGMGGGSGGARGDSTSKGLGFLSTIWNLNVDSMMFLSFLSVYGVQILTYALYFLKYVFV